MRRFSITATIAATVAVALACAPSAGAAPGPPMSVRVQQASGISASYFQVSAQSGQVVPAGALKIGNPTNQSVTVLLDPVNGLTASTLGSAYGLRGSKASGPASWVVLAQRRVVLAPHGSARVPVSVRVGVSVRPGDYLAGIGVQASGAGNVQTHGNVAIASIQRYAVGLLVSVPGPRSPHIRLTGAKLSREPAGVTFSILGTNDGNVILKNVRGQATITTGGHVVTRRTMGPGTFVTGTSIAYPILVPSLRPKVGTDYRVRGYLRYPGGIAQINQMVTFGQIDAMRQQAYGGPKVDNGGGGNNWLLIALIVAAAAACLAFFGVRRRRSAAGSGDGALRRALPQQIAQARANGEPLNLILVPANGRPREAASGVHECLRSRDQLFHLKDSGLVVVSPDTTPEAGEMLAAEIRRKLARGGTGATAVVSVTNAAEYSADELLQTASASAGAGTPANRAGNGTGHEGGTEHTAHGDVNGSGTDANRLGSHDGPHRR
jgi:hypothetical protein